MKFKFFQGFIFRPYQRHLEHGGLCSSHFFNCSHWQPVALKALHNCIIFGAGRRVHTSPLLKQLHWLPVSERIQFKTLTLVFNAFKGQVPVYIQDLLTSHSHTENTRYLRSHANEYTLVQNRTHTSHGDKAFSNSGPMLWNKLPDTLRSSRNSKTFKSSLKSHLFPN